MGHKTELKAKKGKKKEKTREIKFVHSAIKKVNRNSLTHTDRQVNPYICTYKWVVVSTAFSGGALIINDAKVFRNKQPTWLARN